MFQSGVQTGNGLVKITFDTLPTNNAPVAQDDSSTTNEDTPTDVAVLSNDTDEDSADTLSVSGFTPPSHGTVSKNADGTLKYTPEKDFNGEDSFTYKAKDGTAESNAATVSITVSAVNDAPGFARGADQTVNEDAGAQSVPGWATNVSAGPSNESSQQVSLEVTNSNDALFSASGQPKVSPDGTLTYTPEADASSSASVSVKATDDGGTEGGGVDTSAEQSFEITVNDAPEISVVAGSTSQSACLSDTSGRITLKLSDADGDASNLTLSATSSNTRLLPNANVTFGGSGESRTATIATLSGRTRTSTVTITASDAQTSATSTVTLRAGGNGRDTLSGTGGADLLLGQNGDDTLSGQGGNDVLCGANGNDRLSGGDSDSLDSGPGTDTTADFNAGEGDSKTNIP